MDDLILALRQFSGLSSDPNVKNAEVKAYIIALCSEAFITVCLESNVDIKQMNEVLALFPAVKLRVLAKLKQENNSQYNASVVTYLGEIEKVFVQVARVSKDIGNAAKQLKLVDGRFKDQEFGGDDLPVVVANMLPANRARLQILATAIYKLTELRTGTVFDYALVGYYSAVSEKMERSPEKIAELIGNEFHASIITRLKKTAFLPRLDKRVVIGIQAEDSSVGARFIEAYEIWAAKYWPDEWRRPIIIAYLGNNTDEAANRFLTDHAELKFNMVLKVNSEDAESELNIASAFLNKILSLGLNKRTEKNLGEEVAQEELVKLFAQFDVTYLNNHGGLPATTSAKSLEQPVLGILGGMGPLASAACLRLAVKEMNKNNMLGETSSSQSSLTSNSSTSSSTSTSSRSPSPEDIVAPAGILYWSNPGKPQNETGMGIVTLDDFGLWKFLRILADFLAVVDKYCKVWFAPSNTFNGADLPKFSYVHGLGRIEHKLLNMINVVTDYIYSHHADEAVAMLGTSKLKYSQAYDSAFAFKGKKVLINTTDEMQARVQEGINKTKANDVPGAQLIFQDVIKDFVKQGAKVIVLGCTEIHLAVKDIMSDFEEQGITFVDTSAVVANAGVQCLMQKPLMFDPAQKVHDQESFINKLSFILHNANYWHSTIVARVITKAVTNALPDGIKEMRDVIHKDIPIDDKIKELIKIHEQRKCYYQGGLWAAINNPICNRTWQAGELINCIGYLNSAPPDWNKINEIFDKRLAEIEAYHNVDHVPDKINQVARVLDLTKLAS